MASCIIFSMVCDRLIVLQDIRISQKLVVVRSRRSPLFPKRIVPVDRRLQVSRGGLRLLRPHCPRERAQDRVDQGSHAQAVQ